MNKLLISVKRYFIILILILLLAFLIWARLIMAPRVKEPIVPTFSPEISLPISLVSPFPKIPQSINIGSNQKIKFQYSGSTLESPASLPVWKNNQSSQDLSARIKELAKQLGFNKDPDITQKSNDGSNNFVWGQNKQTLLLKERPLAVSFAFDSLVSAGKINLSTKELLNNAKGLIEKLKINNVDFNSAIYTYLSITGEASSQQYLKQTNNPQEADFAGISLTYNLSGYNLLTSAPNNYPLYLLFDASGKLVRMNIFVSTFIQSSSSLSVVPFNKAVGLLDERGIVVFAQSDEDRNLMEIPSYNLTGVDLKGSQISYYLIPGSSDYLYPYYVFQGQAKEEGGKIVEVVVLLPVNLTN